jgi:hypothetical protein
MLEGSRLQLRARRVPPFVRGMSVVIAFALAGASWLSDVGPYAWISNAQASVLHGTHYPQLSVLLTLLVMLVPVGALVHLIATFLPPTADERAAGYH